MKRLIVASAAVLALTACGGDQVGNIGGPNTGGVEVPMPDGRTIPCVIFDSGNYAGGLSCDWDGTR